jgi:hypothetical protein
VISPAYDQGARRFCPASRLPQGPPAATLRVCFHALQLTKLIERANRNQFEAHKVALSQAAGSVTFSMNTTPLRSCCEYH